MLRRLSADAALYTLSNAMVRGLGLLLLPIYVRVLTPADYGRLDLLTVIGSLIAVVAALEVTQGVMRFVADSRADPDDRREWVATAFWITLAAVGAMVAAATVCVPGR